MDAVTKLEDHELFQGIKKHVVRRFVEFHQSNPHVYAKLREFAQEALASGRKRLGFRIIAERFRWHTLIETRGDMYKINNNHLSCYTRLLMLEDRRFEDFFQTRTSFNRRH